MYQGATYVKRSKGEDGKMDIHDKVDQTLPYEKSHVIVESEFFCYLVHLNQLPDKSNNDEKAHACTQDELSDHVKVFPNDRDYVIVPEASGKREYRSGTNYKNTRICHVLCAMCSNFNLLAGSLGNCASTRT